MTDAGPWHFWYAWHPVRTRYHGWTWFSTVYRRQRWTHLEGGYGPDQYWEYDAVTEDDYEA